MTTVHITSINEFPSSGRVQLIFDLIKNLTYKDTIIDCIELRFGLMSKNINTFKSKVF